MLDLQGITEDFIRTRLRKFATETDPDVATVQAISDRDANHEEREKQVLIFLRYYKVIRYFQPANSREIASRILEFADEPRPNALDQNKAAIISEHKKLEERIQPFAPLTKAGEHRKVTSLASKALWCCYPNDVPMFDNNAQRALQIFSRLCRIFPEPGQEEYGCFVDAWLQLYHKIEPVIDQADIKGFPYKIRVLDGILWYMGKPTFDLQSNNMRE